MFRHMAILKFKADAPEQAKQAFLDHFPGVMNSIPEINSWSIGRNAGGGGESHVKAGGYPPNYDVGLVMDFDGPEAYRAYAECGLHYATTRLEIDYRRSTGFDDVIEIAVWLDWVRGASMCIDYELTCNGTCVATASTVHAMVDREGRVRRIPKERAANLRQLALRPAPKSP